MAECSWIRRNRWWLVALPFALVLAMASAAYRVNDFWWGNGWHHAEATVDQGTFVNTRATIYSFDEKPRPADLRVRLGSVSRTDQMRDGLGEELAMPPKAVGVRLRLDFEAVKGKPAPYCTVYVVDTDGNRYEVSALDSGSNPCPPPGYMDGDTHAPRKWSRVVAATLPRGAKAEYVWLGVTWPDYLRFRITEQPRGGVR